MTVSYIDRQTLSALSPTVRPALHLSQTQYGWITGAFSITYLIFAPLSIHYGWRWAFVLVAVIGLSWIPLWLAVTAHPDVKLSLDSHPVDAPKRPLERADILHIARAVILVIAAAPPIMFIFNWGPQL